jgi:hypothetical protein
MVQILGIAAGCAARNQSSSDKVELLAGCQVVIWLLERGVSSKLKLQMGNKMARALKRLRQPCLSSKFTRELLPPLPPA